MDLSPQANARLTDTVEIQRRGSWQWKLRLLRYFIAVAEELHFGRAAARVGIEQSPLSKAITDMERRLGVRLFIRTRRSTQLTYVGETLLPDARRILVEVDQAHRNIKAAALGRRGRLRVAIGDGLADPRIAALFARSRDEDSEIDIQIMHSPWSAQLHGLRSGVLDVGFTLCPSDDRDLRSVPLWKDPAALIMCLDHPLATQPSIRQKARGACRGSRRITTWKSARTPSKSSGRRPGRG